MMTDSQPEGEETHRVAVQLRRFHQRHPAVRQRRPDAALTVRRTLVPASDGVDLFLGEEGARHLAHPLAPFVVDAVAATPEDLAAAYLREVARYYGIPPAYLTNLTAPASNDASSGDTGLRQAERKTLAGVTVISYAQWHLGMAVAGAGVSVTLLDNPLRVTSSYGRFQETVVGTRPAGLEVGVADRLRSITLRGLLALDSETSLRINGTGRLLYRYDPEARVDSHHSREGPESARILVLGAAYPVPTLGPVPDAIRPGEHRIVMDVLFTLQRGARHGINWRAFIDVENGAVLFIRPFVAAADGCVFLGDPVSLSGNRALGPCAKESDLDALASRVTLRGLTTIDGDPQALSGEFVTLRDVAPPSLAPPTVSSTNPHFVFGARSPEFAAVCAYHHCDGVFRMLETWGLPVRSVFDGTRFPVAVDHRDYGGSASPEVQAWAHGNEWGTGVESFSFGAGKHSCPDAADAVGIAADRRVVLHEFCHGLLRDAVGQEHLGFAHSAGDSLAAILCDPSSRAPVRGETFPWLGWDRRHDRNVADGWAWGGRLGGVDYGGEQVLSTTLFRAYLIAGGDSPDITEREKAAEHLAYLIVRAIWSLSRYAPPSMPEHFATALMEADITGSHPPGHGGALHKVIRWAFEQQGLYQAPGVVKGDVRLPGAPPPVDLYIEDGRQGAYEYAGIDPAPGIWNRVEAHSGSVHEPPVPARRDHIYVKVRSRGVKVARDAVVRCFTCRPESPHSWPSDWVPLLTPELPCADIAPGGAAVAGPFPWQPDSEDHACVLAYVSAPGDLSNADLASALPCATGPIPAWELARLDNNTALRQMVRGPSMGA